MKNRGKSRGCTYKSNNISIAKCPRVPKLVLTNAKTIVSLTNYQILKWSYYNIHEY